MPLAMAATGDGPVGNQSIVLLVLGIVLVLGLIIALKLNAFLALFLSALAVSVGIGFFSGENYGDRLSDVIKAFGSSAGGIGVAIAMAAIIGKCMLDSGAADRVVRTAVGVTGEKKASLGLTFSGFILAIPVFFDTVFYLLVPLARSLFRKTNRNYLRYLMAIATGGAITHTLVPPTPGPLLVAATLGVDVGTMMAVGCMIAIPAAAAGLLFSVLVDAKSPIPMRPIGSTQEKHEAPADDQLPALWLSLMPVVLPVVLIGIGTLASTIADSEDLAQLRVDEVKDFPSLAEAISQDLESPATRLATSERLDDASREILRQTPNSDEEKQQFVDAINQVLIKDANYFDKTVFLGVAIPGDAEKLLDADSQRMKPVDRRRMNRLLLEAAYPDWIEPHVYDSPALAWKNRLSLWSNPNFALTLAAIVAMLTLKHARRLSWKDLAGDTEEALMSGGIIILITAAGGAFGAMLAQTNISDTIRDAFEDSTGSGLELLILGWSIAAVLKVAQGSSTVAMIVGAGMMSAIIGDQTPSYHLVYIATAVGTGSLMGSWMNDSGFWIFTKMGGLTEAESLRSWTPLLAVLSLAGLVATIIASQVLPMTGA
ncbi:MAG: SLC13 family permease [Planctomycetota bacterium]